MIDGEKEYQVAVKRLAEERARIEGLAERLRGEGKSDAEVKRVTDPVWSFHLQLAEEVESYERLRAGTILGNPKLARVGAAADWAAHRAKYVPTRVGGKARCP